MGKGTGPGLSLSYGIIRSHGGSISLDTRYEAGAKFVVRIPIEILHHENSRSVPQPEAKAEVGPKHILLVDDEEQILECTRLPLEQKFFRVTAVSSGEEARKLVERTDFDIIVTDMRMPGPIDGRALYDVLSKERPEMTARVIFITGDTLDAETARFLSSVPNPRVKKPFTTEELIDSIAAAGSN